jgi:hypothetical protein
MNLKNPLQKVVETIMVSVTICWNTGTGSTGTGNGGTGTGIWDKARLPGTVEGTRNEA